MTEFSVSRVFGGSPIPTLNVTGISTQKNRAASRVLGKEDGFMRLLAARYCAVLLLFLPGAALGDGHLQFRQLFDFDWKFDLADPPNAQLPGLDDHDWKRVDLPHYWSIGGKIDASNGTGGAGGFFPAGVGWYRKTFQAPLEWRGQRVAVEFEGVYMDSDVWINGQKLGNHPYGYTPFVYDVTPYLKLGSSNTLAVRVDNSHYINSRWYSGSGIYRHVWIDVEPPLHVVPWGIQVTTPSIANDSATCLVRITLKNDSSVESQATISTRVFSPDNAPVAQSQSEISLPAGAQQTIEQPSTIAQPALWSPDTPRLYRAVTTVHSVGRVDAEYQTHFGVRTIKVSAEKGFELNGIAIKFDGGCVHHDNGPFGAEAFDRAEERKVELLKSAGFNAVRTAHNPPSTAFLDACDRLGLLVLDEAFDCWDLPKINADYSNFFNDWWQRDLDAMVRRDRNHPSVVMWSLGNEIPNAGAPGGIRVGTMLADRLRSLDATRPITAGIFWYNGIHGADGSYWDWTDADPLFAKLDVCGYNYQLDSFQPDHQRFPKRVIVSTESLLADAFRVWRLTRQHSYAIGDFVWSAMDYLGEAGVGRYYNSDEEIIGHGTDAQFPYHGAICGDLDITGWRKPISHYRNILWDRGEKLYTTVLQPSADGRPYLVEEWGILPNWPSWTWPGFNGKTLRVLVCARYQRVSLYLNDKLIGTKPTTESDGFQAMFDVPYEPGVLKTVGLRGDKSAEQNVLQTAGPAKSIRLEVDRAVINADGEDLAFVTVQSLDADGRWQPNCDLPVTFHLEGPGLVAGLASGDYSRVLMYQGNLRPLFHGRAETVIRSTRLGGVITLTATADGLTPGTVRIEARRPSQ
jgi:beta-galactosidase